VKGSGLLFYTFVAIALYLVLSRPKGSIGLLGTAFRGYQGSVAVLQGRQVIGVTKR
jgi:hypothetical protein